MRNRPAVFFDRDGVLNFDSGYVHKKEDFKWVSGAPEIIKWLNDNDFFVFVVTNQAGVARGYYKEEDIHELHVFMSEELRTIGAHIDAFYYCPHHKDGKVEKYRIECKCRKPEPGMISRAIREWPISIQRSFMVGDKESDVKAAHAAGISGYLFHGSNIYEFVKNRIKEQVVTG